MDNPRLAAALEYDQAGLSVIAIHGIVDGRCTCGRILCSSPGKHPIGKWKHRQLKKATEADIRKQWDQTPWANVGIVTGAISNLVVLDIDDIESFEEYLSICPEFDKIETPIVLTGRSKGGMHFYFRHPGGKLSNFANKLPGIDGRADGGYVVAPPSLHESGEQYRFRDESHGFCIPPSELPKSILTLFQGHDRASSEPSEKVTKYAQEALTQELIALNNASEGSRNDTLNKAAFNLGQLINDKQLDRNHVRDKLSNAAAKLGLTQDEIYQTIESGFDGGRNKPRSPHSAKTNNNELNHKTLPLEFFDDINFDASNLWLIDNILPQNSLALIYGNSGGGKSWIAGDFAMRLAAGMDACNQKVTQCSSIYIAAEGQNGFRQRVAAFRQYHQREGIPFAMIPQAVDLLSNTGDFQAVVEAVETAAERFGQSPGLIVVDTLAATFGSGDENGNDMVVYSNRLAQLRDLFGCTVCTVHHRPKDQSNDGPRGHGSLRANMDTILLIEGDGHRRIKVYKQKDAEETEAQYFDLQKVEIGDANGEIADGAVVRYTSVPADQRVAGLTKEAYMLLESLLADNDDDAIEKNVWQKQWMDTKSDNQLLESRRRSFGRVRQALLSRKIIKYDGNMVSIVLEKAFKTDA